MRAFILSAVTILSGATLIGSFFAPVFWALTIVFLPLSILAWYDATQSKHALLRNFPLLGRTRYMAEWMRPKIYQYFVEPDHDGRPFSRLTRNVIYRRSKKLSDTTPFGTQLDVYSEGYEWMDHSIAALDHHHINPNPRVKVCGKTCTQPYDLSILNVSAMSYGSLSSAAVEALNAGAKLGGFAHNTGEGGISPFHLKHGGDLIYQVGTGYFGCRTKDGLFDDLLFEERTAYPSVKMIEIKLSQGAKPGHGGILPAKKATPDIAAIRNIEPYKDVLSPPYHTAFTTPLELVHFIAKCQKLSKGKPVGFKLCVGKKQEFIAICKAMVETGIRPNFITVDGGEGGTGAAPLEFTNAVGAPLREGLSFVYDALIGFGLKQEICLIAAGKVTSGFELFKAFALGADACYSARAMMMALGCIQALECNSNTCPTGVATQDQKLMKGLVVEDKKVRIHQFHENTVKSFVELLAASGLNHQDRINRTHVHRRVSTYQSRRYDEIYPYITEGCLLQKESVPSSWFHDWSIATSKSFSPRFEEVYIEED